MTFGIIHIIKGGYQEEVYSYNQGSELRLS